MSTPPNPGVRFDKTINLGHVLTMGGFMVAMLLQWNMMDKRVTVLEETRLTQRERDTVQDSNARENAQAVKEALGDLKRSVEKLSDKLETKNASR